MGRWIILNNWLLLEKLFYEVIYMYRSGDSSSQWLCYKECLGYTFSKEYDIIINISKHPISHGIGDNGKAFRNERTRHSHIKYYFISDIATRGKVISGVVGQTIWWQIFILSLFREVILSWKKKIHQNKRRTKVSWCSVSRIFCIRPCNGLIWNYLGGQARLSGRPRSNLQIIMNR